MIREELLVKVASGFNQDEVFERLNEIRSGQGRILSDDNGAPPDGTAWIAPLDEFDPFAVKELVREGALLVVQGDIIEGYDGTGSERVLLEERYPLGWAGFSSRGEAYGQTNPLEE
jgi:hypothetical protein